MGAVTMVIVILDWIDYTSRIRNKILSANHLAHKIWMTVLNACVHNTYDYTGAPAMSMSILCLNRRNTPWNNLT